ncbi:MAG: hypothetical protein EXS49_00960 [Candidatus Pacebacteria bacterium]|nr:hypothetical protein [Candidatus Paceibacterota bacterium]
MNKIKLTFGTIIFLFSSALAFFSASYISQEKLLGYYSALLIFGGVYLIVGILIAKIYPVSLGFLFAADVIILRALSEDYKHYGDMSKVFITGAILIILYFVAWRHENKVSSDVN